MRGDRADDGNLSLSAYQSERIALRGVHILRLSADIGFINFNVAKQLRQIGILHRGTNARAHIPRGFVRAGSHHAMNLMRADAFLRVSHDEHDLKPRAQRVFCILENRFRDHAESVAVATTTILALTYPVEWAMRDVEHLRICASRTLDNAVGPSALYQKPLAIVLGLELGQQLIEGSHEEKYSDSRVWCQQPDNPLP